MWSSACPAAMPPARVVAGARRRARAPRRVASVVVSGDPARHSPARARHTSALGRRLADANATPLATRASASSRRASRRAALRVVPAAVREPGERGYEPASASDDAAARADDPRAVASGPAGPSPTAARRARDAARAADRYVAEEGDRRGRERTVAETRRTRPRGARPARQSNPVVGVVLVVLVRLRREDPARSAVTPRGRKSNRYNRPDSAARRTPKRLPRPRPPPLRPRIGRSGYRINTRVDPRNSRSSVGDAEAERRERHAPGRAYRGGDGGTPRRTSSRASPRETSAASTTSKMESRRTAVRLVRARRRRIALSRRRRSRRSDAPASSSDRVRSARRSVHAAVSHISKFSAPRSTSPSRNWANAADSISNAARCIFG